MGFPLAPPANLEHKHTERRIKLIAEQVTRKLATQKKRNPLIFQGVSGWQKPSAHSMTKDWAATTRGGEHN